MADGYICYKLYNQKKNWTEARAVCQSKDGDLVSVRSKYDSLLVSKILLFGRGSLFDN